ncbi:MAG: glycosyltransferase [Halobacteriota archaeon]
MSRAVDVSVIVPVYNDPVGVRATLVALAEQTYAKHKYEVIVVDNGSDDETPEVVREYAERYDFARFESETRIQGSYAARNTGLDEASGTVIAFLDADVTVESSWLESVVERMHADGHDYLGCAVEILTAPPETSVSKFNRRHEFPVEEYLRTYDFAPTCCLAVRREVIETVGGFDGALRSSGDKEFGQRVRDAGFDQHYAGDLVAYHPARSAGELVRKYVRIGRGFEQLDRRYPGRFDHRPLTDRRNFLPGITPNELPEAADRVKKRTDTDVGAVDLIVFFVLDYATTLARTAGRILERVHPTPLSETPEWCGYSTSRGT